MAIFCFAESRYAANLGRLSMGHELVRGIRFLVPLSLLMIVAAVRIILPRIVIRPGVCCVIALVAILPLTAGMWPPSMPWARRRKRTLPLAEGRKTWPKNAEKRAKFLEKIEGTVPKGQGHFQRGRGHVAIRYIALRPLAHVPSRTATFTFYNKDLAGSKKWLELEGFLPKTQRPDQGLAVLRRALAVMQEHDRQKVAGRAYTERLNSSWMAGCW